MIGALLLIYLLGAFAYCTYWGVTVKGLDVSEATLIVLTSTVWFLIVPAQVAHYVRKRAK